MNLVLNTHPQFFPRKLKSILQGRDEDEMKSCLAEIADWPGETSLAHIAVAWECTIDLDRPCQIEVIRILADMTRNNNFQGAVAARRLSCFVGDQNFQRELLTMSAHGFNGTYVPGSEGVVEEAAQVINLLGYGEAENRSQGHAIRFITNNLKALRAHNLTWAVQTAHKILDYARANKWAQSEFVCLCRFLTESLGEYCAHDWCHAVYIARDLRDILPHLIKGTDNLRTTLLNSSFPVPANDWEGGPG